MSDIKAGDRIVLTAAVPDSKTYPFLKAGLEGVVLKVHPSKDPQYSVEFKGRFVVDPDRAAMLAVDPVYLFDRTEIELTEG